MNSEDQKSVDELKTYFSPSGPLGFTIDAMST